MNIRDEWKWLLPLMAVSLLVFANSVGGDFVYDDTRQIVRNTLIQDNGLIWKALTSDVWAFKGDGTQAASNYWRPTFTAWHILNMRLFGLNPAGWHFTSLLLHSGVCILAYGLLRRWAFSASVAFIVALLFAVHPIHVESVAWISGSPDLLFSTAILLSLWFAQSYAETKRSKYLVYTVLLYALALGAKEIGVVCLPIYYFVLTYDVPKSEKQSSALMPLLLLSSTAVAYFVTRWSILGAVSRPPDDAVAIGDAMLSVPMMFSFYVRQIFFPYWIGANYPLEPVTQIGVSSFLIPIGVSLVAIAGILYLSKATHRGRIGAALFLLPLVTAMNATAFISEQMVHDRYLYLPLLGMLMLIIPAAAKLVSERNLVLVGITIGLVLAFQSIRYNLAWASELKLWSWTVNVDDSSFTSMQYGNALIEADRNEEAIAAYSNAVAKKPVARGYIGRGRCYLKAKQYAKAETDLSKAISQSRDIEVYALYQAYEALGIVFSEQRRYDDALKNFNIARQELPIYSAAITVSLAVVQYQKGQKLEALRELEGAREQARRELLPESKAVFMRLGMLYVEQGRKEDARVALTEYLNLTSTINDKTTVSQRNQAMKLLEGAR